MEELNKIKEKPLYRDKNLLIIFSITLISIMGVASLTPAFPRIAKAFNITPKEVGLLITVFTMPGIILTPILGILADRFGRKRIVIPALFLFAIAGGLCFFAKSFHLLVILRLFQGCGAAALGSLNATIIGDIFSAKDRTAAMGYNSSVISIGTAVYPIIGGALATFAWYYPFLLPLLALIVGLIVLIFLKYPEPRNEQTIKQYFLNAAKSLSQFKITGLLFMSLLTFILLYGPWLTYLPFLIEDHFLEPPYVVGIIMAFSSIASFTASSQLRKLIKYFPEKKLILIGTFFYALAMLSVPFMHNVWFLIFSALSFGFAMGLNLPSIQSLLVSYAPVDQRAAIMSVNGMTFSLGQTLGPLLVVPVYAIWGVSGAYGFGVCVAALMCCAILIMITKKI